MAWLNLHILIRTNDPKALKQEWVHDLSEDELEHSYLTNMREGVPIVAGGKPIDYMDIDHVKIYQHNHRLQHVDPMFKTLQIALMLDVTNKYIRGPVPWAPKAAQGVKAGNISINSVFDQLVTNVMIRNASRQLFVDGHYARVVEEAFKCLNNAVKSKSGLTESDGDILMRKAFSLNKPKLRFNRLRTTTEQNEQRGYMEMFAGAMAAIRNPRAHEHSLQDDPRTALELLAFANHLMNKLAVSKKTRRRKRSP